MTSPTSVEAGHTATRRKARIVALQVLYETDGVGHEPTAALANLLDHGPDTAAEEYARKLLAGVLEQRQTIDAIIAKYAPSWPVNQMAMVDRNILRVAIYEIELGGETPPKVAINEAVEIAKLFGSDSSPRLVNGVLGSVLKAE